MTSLTDDDIFAKKSKLDASKTFLNSRTHFDVLGHKAEVFGVEAHKSKMSGSRAREQTYFLIG